MRRRTSLVVVTFRGALFDTRKRALSAAAVWYTVFALRKCAADGCAFFKDPLRGGAALEEASDTNEDVSSSSLAELPTIPEWDGPGMSIVPSRRGWVGLKVVDSTLVVEDNFLSPRLATFTVLALGRADWGRAGFVVSFTWRASVSCFASCWTRRFGGVSGGGGGGMTVVRVGGGTGSVKTGREGEEGSEDVEDALLTGEFGREVAEGDFFFLGVRGEEEVEDFFFLGEGLMGLAGVGIGRSTVGSRISGVDPSGVEDSLRGEGGELAALV